MHAIFIKARRVEASLSYLVFSLLKDFSHAENLNGAPRVSLGFPVESTIFQGWGCVYIPLFFSPSIALVRRRAS